MVVFIRKDRDADMISPCAQFPKNGTINVNWWGNTVFLQSTFSLAFSQALTHVVLQPPTSTAYRSGKSQKAGYPGPTVISTTLPFPPKHSFWLYYVLDIWASIYPPRKSQNFTWGRSEFIFIVFTSYHLPTHLPYVLSSIFQVQFFF